jgi:hypothetical protein
MRHVFGSCACRWFTCLLMLVYLLNACVFTAYSISCIRSRVHMFFKFKFSYISTRVVIYHQKGGDCSDLGPFSPLLRVCFGDK